MIIWVNTGYTFYASFLSLADVVRFARISELSTYYQYLGETAHYTRFLPVVDINAARQILPSLP
jgi:hypothetical protein